MAAIMKRDGTAADGGPPIASDGNDKCRPSCPPQGEQMPRYVRLKRRRDEPPPPFLCVMRPQKRQQLSRGGASGMLGVLERAIVFKHVDAAPPPVPAAALDAAPLQQQQGKQLNLHASDRQEASKRRPAAPCTLHMPSPNTTPELDDTSKAQNVSAEIQGRSLSAVDAESAFGNKKPPAAVDEAATFWSAFNTPLRPDVFGPFASFHSQASGTPTTSLGYHDAVEEAVKSLRRFRVDAGPGGGSSCCSAQRSEVLLASGACVQVLDVCHRSSDSPVAAESMETQPESNEFEYDLYAVECDSEDSSPWDHTVRVETLKLRLLELLQQDVSTVALVEVEDVDEDTGMITRGKGSSMQVFLEEFGDIDDCDSDEGGEIDYPSGESSDEGERTRPGRRWHCGSSGDSSEGSSKSGDYDYFEDDDF